MTKTEIKTLKAGIADLFIQREKLQAGLGQTSQQLQIKLNLLQKETEKKNLIRLSWTKVTKIIAIKTVGLIY